MKHDGHQWKVKNHETSSAIKKAVKRQEKNMKMDFKKATTMNSMKNHENSLIKGDALKHRTLNTVSGRV